MIYDWIQLDQTRKDHRKSLKSNQEITNLAT